MMASRFTSLLATAAIALMQFASPVWAIPNTHLNPHPHDPGKIAFPAGPLPDPDAQNHTHVDGIGVTEVSGRMRDNAATPRWESTGAWDDRFYRDFDLGNTEYGHGYIDPDFRARYGFAGDVPAGAQGLIDMGLVDWDTAAKAQGQNSRTAPDGTPIKTSVVMQNVGVNPAVSDWTVDFIEGFEESNSAFAEWCFDGCAGLVNPLTLVFEATPTNSLFFDGSNNNNDNWMLRVDGGAWGTSYTETVGWSLDKTPALLGSRDIDYKAPDNTIWEGTEAGFGAFNLDVTTNTFWDIGSPDNFLFYEMDFYTIALHELGHVIGLLHDPSSAAGAADSIMRTQIAFDVAFGPPLLQTIDIDSAKGAAALYSISTPEPGTALLLSTGLIILILIGLARRRRRQCNLACGSGAGGIG